MAFKQLEEDAEAAKQNPKKAAEEAPPRRVHPPIWPDERDGSEFRAARPIEPGPIGVHAAMKKRDTRPQRSATPLDFMIAIVLEDEETSDRLAMEDDDGDRERTERER